MTGEMQAFTEFGKQKHKQRNKQKELNMKKTMMQLAITGMVLACATTVFAGPITSRLQAGDCLHEVDRGIHKKAYGYVVLTETSGGYDVTYELWNAAPSYPYYASYNITPGGPPGFLGWLITDKKGRGSLTAHVTTDLGTWGPWIGLREKSGLLSTCKHPLPPYTPQGLLAAPNPFNPPPPATP
jgi:hypothetical protein